MLTASCVFIVLGAVMILSGAVWSFYQQCRQQYRGRSTGTVVEVVPGQPDEEGLRAGIHDYYYPVVAFYANGLLYKLQYERGSNPPAYKTGDRIEICYDEDKPYHFEPLTENKNMKLAKMIYCGGFAACCMGGIFFLIFATRG